MGRERRLDQLIRKGLEWKTGAYTPSIEDEIIRFRDRIQDEIAQQDEAVDVEFMQRKATEKQFKELYGLLTYEQYTVLYMANVDKMSREQIREKTGKSKEALRKNIYDAKQALNRMGLWEKFTNLFSF
jgi:DNA-directed RNA polymerase specialized sigma24 family protein